MLIALVDNIGDYYDLQNTDMCHAHSGKWHFVFKEDEKMPVPDEGNLTSCYLLRRPENIAFLYKKYLDDITVEHAELPEELKASKVYSVEPVYEEEKKDGNKMTQKMFPLNQILYGPPGTGKTYNTVIKAVDICDWDKEKPADYDAYLERYRRLQKEGRIAFTTFHQAYGYEEFIEGIKPVLGDSEKENNSDLKYEIKSGAFKEFCESETTERTKALEKLEINKDAKVWKVTFNGTGDNLIRQDCLDNNRIRVKDNIDEWENGIVGGRYIGDVPVFQALVNDMKIGDIVVSHFGKDTIDAIGVIISDYESINLADNLSLTEQEVAELSVMKKLHYYNFKNSRQVKWLLKENINVSSYLNNKMQSNPAIYQLEDMSVDRVLHILAEHNVVSSVEVVPGNKVFIIDEINRGNISKIFGELITLIEPSKRLGASEAMSVKLPYSGKQFGVPNNVYIIGTMNTADRSIALMDTALRRRFEFEEMMPKVNVLEDRGVGKVKIDGVEVNIAAMLEIINERITYLFDREHNIGHAYFMSLKPEDKIESLANIFSKKIIPLLQEYFFDDYQKISAVLGDNYKAEINKFIKEIPAARKNLFGKKPGFDVDVDRKQYVINVKALELIESYIKIYKYDEDALQVNNQL